MAISYDNASYTSPTLGNISFTHKVTHQDNRYLFVLTNGNSDTSHAITSVTYAGVSMTNLYEFTPSGGTFSGNCPRIIVWGLANPASGSNTVSISKSAGTYMIASAVSYYGVGSVQPKNVSAYATTGGQVGTTFITLTNESPDWMAAFWYGYNTSRYINSSGSDAQRVRIPDGGYQACSIIDSNAAVSGAYSINGTWDSSSGFMSVVGMELYRYRGIAITGPVGGNLNTASSNFTITPSESMNGTVTITPSGPGATGLSATVLNFSTATPQTFTITPTTSGLITLTVTNSAGFQNEGPWYYTVNTPTAKTANIMLVAGGGAGTVGYTNTGGTGGGYASYTTEPIAQGTYVIAQVGTGGAGAEANPPALPGIGGEGTYTQAFNYRVNGSVSPNSGNGYSNSINGTAITYAVAGGSSSSPKNNTTKGSGSDGVYYTASNPSAAGKDGVFIISYPTASTMSATGGTKTTSGSDTIHTFTTSGTLVVTTEPGIPTIGTAVPGNTTASVAFTAPSENGGSTITGYTVTSTPGNITSSGASSPLTVTGLTNGVSYTFTAKATNANGSSNNSSASNAVVPYTPASSFTFTGPSGGAVRSASTVFTITPNSTYLGTVTITPTGAGSTGLTPTTLTWNLSSAAQTFTITPLDAGAITLTCTNSNGISNPTALVYTATAVVPLAPVIGLAQGSTGSARVECTAPSNDGGADITLYTATSTPGGVTGTKASAGIIDVQGLTNGVEYTFTVTATNSAGESAASSASNAVTPSLSSTNFTNGGPKFNIERNVGNIISF